MLLEVVSLVLLPSMIIDSIGNEESCQRLVSAMSAERARSLRNTQDDENRCTGIVRWPASSGQGTGVKQVAGHWWIPSGVVASGSLQVGLVGFLWG